VSDYQLPSSPCHTITVNTLPPPQCHQHVTFICIYIYTYIYIYIYIYIIVRRIVNAATPSPPPHVRHQQHHIPRECVITCDGSRFDGGKFDGASLVTQLSSCVEVLRVEMRWCEVCYVWRYEVKPRCHPICPDVIPKQLSLEFVWF
jgi:hypothetical protein